MGFYILIGAVILGFASVFFSEPVSSILYHVAALIFVIYWILGTIEVFRNRKDPIERALDSKKKKKN